MYRLSLWIVLSLLSLHVKASTSVQNFYDETAREHQVAWMESARQAEAEGLTSEHLVDILKVEDIVFEAFLSQQESQLTSCVQWQKHAIVTLAVFHLHRSACRGAALSVASDFNHDLVWHAVWRATEEAVCDLPIKASEVGEARKELIKGVLSELKNVGMSGVLNLMDQIRVASVSSILAKRQAWMIVLDPRQKSFEKLYQAFYPVIENLSEEELQKWFDSKEIFNAKINHFLVHSEDLNADSRNSLQPLVKQLRRICEKTAS